MSAIYISSSVTTLHYLRSNHRRSENDEHQMSFAASDCPDGKALDRLFLACSAFSAFSCGFDSAFSGRYGSDRLAISRNLSARLARVPLPVASEFQCL